MAAIAYAKDNMGDFKLKSASDYVVPDHLRMNTNKARSRLLDLKEYVRPLLSLFSVSLEMFCGDYDIVLFCFKLTGICNC